jgi:protein SCO1/2
MLYFGCPRLCNLALNGLGDVLQKMSQKPGKAYRVLAISIDEREGVSNAFDKRAVYLKSWNFKPDEEESVIFHVASASESKRLADSLGFQYFYDKRDDQFAHGAGIFFLSSSPDKKGLLARTLFGIEFKPNDVKLALSEASLGKFGSFLDRVILSCFHYEPDSQRYGIYIMGVMRLGGVLTMLIVGSFLLISFRGERRRAAVLK